MIKKALISVYDKTGLEEILPILQELGVEIISSGGTACRIKDIGYDKIIDVGKYTGHPESPGGLVKTLHPKIHAGLLLNPDISEHEAYMKKHGVNSIDLVIVNLYPFEEVVAKGANVKLAAENIDIGGPSMIRSAAKAALLYERVAVVVDPSDYPDIVFILKENKGEIPSGLVKKLAKNAFKHTANYEKAIMEYLRGL